MNIFPIEERDNKPCPVLSAQSQCDKHVPKMVVETAQMLSTAHRVIDGELYEDRTKNNRRVKRWRLNENDDVIYKAAHVNHPCSIWCRETDANYRWLWEHLKALCEEYTHRYGRVHKTEEVMHVLEAIPNNIKRGPLTKMPLAMQSNPECMFDDVVKSYRAFYQTKQNRFKMVWSNRKKPEWFSIINIENET